MLLCDVGDPGSLAAMARQTRLVLNCVGPVSAPPPRLLAPFFKKKGWKRNPAELCAEALADDGSGSLRADQSTRAGS